MSKSKELKVGGEKSGVKAEITVGGEATTTNATETTATRTVVTDYYVYNANASTKVTHKITYRGLQDQLIKGGTQRQSYNLFDNRITFRTKVKLH